MKERPIIFSGEMVRGTLDGRKTRHSIPIEPQPEVDSSGNLSGCWLSKPLGGLLMPKVTDLIVHCPYGQVGDRLWVKETWAWDNYGQQYWYAADRYLTWVGGWNSAITMPQKASRITLEITQVRVERLQDITRTGIYAEGFTVPTKIKQLPDDSYKTHLLKSFREFWDSTNKKHPWHSNPWVWVIDFFVIKEDQPMQKPCHNCPFWKNSPIKLPLERRQEIADSLNKNQIFTCHKTHHLPYHKQTACVGSAIAMGDGVFKNIAYRLHMRFGNLNPDKLDRKNVLSIKEWLNDNQLP